MTAALPVRNVPMSGLSGLDEVLWFGGPLNLQPTCRAVAEHAIIAMLVECANRTRGTARIGATLVCREHLIRTALAIGLHHVIHASERTTCIT